MTGKIYLIGKDGTLQALIEQGYASEELLQTLLADHPDLLAGEQIDDAAPRRWLLISREVGIPSEDDGAGRWSLDHLFLDQDGIPTLVEVKRSTDTRIRREVVGQMLDYAANAVVYWPLETIRRKFEAACESDGGNPDLVVLEFLQVDIDAQEAIEAFWAQVRTNLRAGRVRLVFVADEIPSELRRIVEFLNAQMDPAQVLAVEISQYVGHGLRTLVPRVIGQTAEAERAKSTARPTRKWDEPSFFHELETRQGEPEVEIARRILEWARPRTTRIWWGQGVRNGSYVPVLEYQGRNNQLFAVWTTGYVEIYFQWYQYKAPFESEESRRELLDRLNAIPNVSLPDDSIARRPSIPLKAFEDPAALDQFLQVFEWFLNQITAT